jgi:hypothetical protein
MSTRILPQQAAVAALRSHMYSVAFQSLPSSLFHQRGNFKQAVKLILQQGLSNSASCRSLSTAPHRSGKSNLPFMEGSPVSGFTPMALPLLQV